MMGEFYPSTLMNPSSSTYMCGGTENMSNEGFKYSQRRLDDSRAHKGENERLDQARPSHFSMQLNQRRIFVQFLFHPYSLSIVIRHLDFLITTGDLCLCLSLNAKDNKADSPLHCCYPALSLVVRSHPHTNRSKRSQEESLCVSRQFGASLYFSRKSQCASYSLRFKGHFCPLCHPTPWIVHSTRLLGLVSLAQLACFLSQGWRWRQTFVFQSRPSFAVSPVHSIGCLDGRLWS
jgi:hypothetical protein